MDTFGAISFKIEKDLIKIKYENIVFVSNFDN